MADYWTSRALPVLRALRSTTDPNVRAGFLSLGRGRGERTLELELSEGAVHDTILQLADAGYVEFAKLQYETGEGAHFSGLHVTGRGLQILGEWPRFEALDSPLTLAALLDALADYAPQNEAKEMRRAADITKRIAGGTLRSLAFGAGSQLLRHSLGLP